MVGADELADELADDPLDVWARLSSIPAIKLSLLCFLIAGIGRLCVHLFEVGRTTEVSR